MPMLSVLLPREVRRRRSLGSGIVLLVFGLANSWLWWMHRGIWPEPQFVLSGLLSLALLVVGATFLLDVLYDAFQHSAWRGPLLKAGIIALPFLLTAMGLFALRNGELKSVLICFGFALAPLPLVHQALGGRLRYGRLSYFALAFSAVGMVLLGLGALLEPDSESFAGWLIIGFFLPAALFCLARMVSPRFLVRWRDIEATSQGLTLTRTNGEVVTIPWAEIESVGRTQVGGSESLGLRFVNIEQADRTYRLYSPVRGWLARLEMRLMFTSHHLYFPSYEVHALGKDPKILARDATVCWIKAWHTRQLG